MNTIPNSERQRLGALLDRQSQESVMKQIPQFSEAQICNLAAPPEEVPDSLGALVFNMERGVHLEELGDFLLSCPRIRPFDVILANELDDGCVRSGGRDTARDLAQRLGMNYVYGLEFIELVKEKFPETEYDPISRILKVEKKDKKRIGKIAVCSAGTADIPVAEEAAQTAEYFGTNVERIYDVGVSGMHRLFSRLETIQSANCVIAVAGMEGALASVMGGLVSRPVIAVPTSVGYGASMHGLSALLTMINSCANGIAVVNIDNGYGAGYLATQINRLAAGTDEKGN